MFRDGMFNTAIKNAVVQITWPCIRFKPYGFQLIADTAIRIDVKHVAFGFSLLGFGVGVAMR